MYEVGYGKERHDAGPLLFYESGIVVSDPKPFHVGAMTGRDAAPDSPADTAARPGS